MTPGRLASSLSSWRILARSDALLPPAASLFVGNYRSSVLPSQVAENVEDYPCPVGEHRLQLWRQGRFFRERTVCVLGTK